MNSYLDKKNPRHFYALKALHIMRLSLLFLILSISAAIGANAYSQSTTISLHMDNATIEDVINSIESQSEFRFIYNKKIVDVKQKVIISAEEESIYSVLDNLLKNSDITYIISDRHIALNKKEAAAPSPLPQQQKKTITGVITDEAGEAVIGANVVEKGTNNGTITNLDGEFSLNVSENATLQVSYIGYLIQETAVNNRTNLKLVLKEDTQNLDEVVVVGYGTQKKVNLTGSVSVVDGQDLAERPVANITQSLQGLVPGLNVGMTKQGGTPGASLNLNIRGKGNLSDSDKPYVLVDGMEQDLNSINPNDIESISILKDAAAASIYGARAAYGVILITTKKGKEGKTSFSYNGNFGMVRPINLPDLVNSYEFAKYFNAGWKNGTGGVEYSDEKLALLEQYCKNPAGIDTWPEQTGNWFTVENSPLGVGNTNFYDIHYKNLSFKQDHNLSATGGSEKIQYYVSGGYYSEDGLLRHANVDYERTNLNSKINAQLLPWLKMKVNTKYTTSNSTSPFGGHAINEDMFFHNMVRFRPTVSAYDTNGRFTEISQVPYLKSGSKNKNKDNVLGLLTGFEISPLKNWNIFVDYNYRFISGKNEQTGLPALIYGMDNSTRYEARQELGVPINGSYYRKTNQSTYKTFNIYSTYDYTLNDSHNFKLMVGGQEDSYRYTELWSKATELLSFNNPGLDVASGTKTTGEKRNAWATRGFFARLNYDFEGKYLLELNGRYDGSSRFAKDDRWGFFPSISVGYNIAHEDFMEKTSDWLSSLKLRGSFGYLGNQAGAGLYTFAETMGTATQGTWFFENGKEMLIYAPGSFNPNTTWEKIENINVGVDFGLLDNQLTGSFEWYQRTTRDMLGPTAKLASMYGAKAPQTNNAVMRNRGWELSIGYKGRINKDITYSIVGMLSDYNAVVREYENPTKYDPKGTWYPGKKVGEIWGYRADGLIQTQAEADEYNKLDLSYLTGQTWVPGDVKYKDLNGDGKIDTGSNTVGDMGDREIIGNTTPRYQYSLNGAITWKNLTLTMLWQGVGKRDYDPGSSVMFYGAGAKAQVAVYKQHLDYWREDNPKAYYPNPYIATVGSIGSLTAKTMQTCDRYIQNAAYIRLKNLMVNYELPKEWTEKIGLQRTNVFFSRENLLTFTKLPKMFEPESVFVFGSGGKNYAQAQVFSFGLNVSF